MREKCQNAGVKAIFISDLVFTTRVNLPTLEKIHETLASYCSEITNCVYIDNRNIRGIHLYKDGLHLLQLGKDILANNFIFYLNKFLNTHTHTQF